MGVQVKMRKLRWLILHLNLFWAKFREQRCLGLDIGRSRNNVGGPGRGLIGDCGTLVLDVGNEAALTSMVGHNLEQGTSLAGHQIPNERIPKSFAYSLTTGLYSYGTENAHISAQSPAIP